MAEQVSPGEIQGVATKVLERASFRAGELDIQPAVVGVQKALAELCRVLDLADARESLSATRDRQRRANADARELEKRIKELGGG